MVSGELNITFNSFEINIKICIVTKIVVVIYKFSSARCVDDDRIDPVNQVARKERQPGGGGSEAKLFEITQTDH